MNTRERMRRAHRRHVGAMILFGLVALMLAALIAMGVAGIGFPKWLLALTTVF